MLTISVELLQGTFRADPDGTANTGILTRGEWPPAPSRLLAALVAADGTRDRCRVTDGSELEWFEQLPAPEIHAHAQPWPQPLRPRYVVEHKGSPEKSTHQEYLGRKGTPVRPGVRVTPRYPEVVYSWDTDAPSDLIEAIRRRAARVGYLGTADSPVRMRVATSMPDLSVGEVFVPDADGDVEISVPEAGDVRILDAMYDQWVERGAGVARAQFPALRHQVRYRSPLAMVPEDNGSVVAWLLLDRAISGRRLTPLTALLKEAILSRHQAMHGEPPAVLHGHGIDGNGYDLARFLALPDVGYPRSRGRIHGMALWLPPGCDAIVRQRARDAAFAVRRLTGRGIDASVMPRDNEPRAPRGQPCPLDPVGALLGRGLPGAARASRPPRPGASVALVRTRRASGARAVPVGALSAGARSGRSRTRGGEPAREAGTPVLPRQAVVRGTGCRAGSDRRRQTARIGAVRTG